MATHQVSGHSIRIMNRSGRDEDYTARCLTCDETVAYRATMTIVRRQVGAHTRVAASVGPVTAPTGAVPEVPHYLDITHHPDLLAAVQREARDRYGFHLETWEADAALLWVEACPPIEAPHHAAATVLRGATA